MAYEAETQASIAFAQSMMAAKRSVDAGIRWEASRILAQEKAHQASLKLMNQEDQARLRGIENAIRAQRSEDELSRARADALVKAYNGLKEFASGSMAATNSVYNTDQAFTAVLPTLDVMGRALEAVIGAIQGMAAGIPVIGSVFEGFSDVLKTGLQLSIQQTKIQIENTQKFVNTFTQLSKAGIGFGGAITDLITNAHKAGLSVDSYAKLISSNLANLSSLGGGVIGASEKIGALAKNVAKADKSMLTLMGSQDELAGGIADFLATVSHSGSKLNQNLSTYDKPAAAYIRTLKEITELTGMSADAQRKEMEERNKSSAFQMALADEEAKQEGRSGFVQEALNLTVGTTSKELGAFVTELVRNRGVIKTQENLEFQARNQVAARTGRQIYESLQGARDNSEIIGNTAKIIQDNNKAMYEEGERQRVLMQQVDTAQSDLLTRQNSHIAQMRRHYNNVEGLNQAREAAEKRAADAKKEGEGPEDEKSMIQAYAKAIEKLNEAKIRIDDQIRNNIKDVGVKVDKLYEINTKLATISELLPKLIDKFTPKIVEFLKRLQTEQPPPLIGPNAPPISPDTEQSRPPHQGPARNENQNQSTNRPEDRTQPRPPPRNNNAPPPAPAPVSSAPNYDNRGFTQNLPPGVSIAAEHTNTQNRGIQERMYKALEKLATVMPIQITALNDFVGPHKTGAHADGLGVDIKTRHLSKAQINQLIEALKSDTANIDSNKTWFESPNEADFDGISGKTLKGGTGPHIHATAKKMARGGITDGVSIAGEEGPEAVIPLPDGRQIPVKIDLSELVTKLEELITVAKSHADISEKHLYASV